MSISKAGFQERIFMNLTSSGKFLVLSFLLAVLSASRSLGADLEDRIAGATDAGIRFLLGAIESRQVTGGKDFADKFANGKIALETYALVVAGVSVEHPLIQKNFEILSRDPLSKTYTTACYAFALDAAISQLQGDAALAGGSTTTRMAAAIRRAYLPRLEAAIHALVDIRNQGKGNWDYGGRGGRRGAAGKTTARRPAQQNRGGGGRFDNSNTQFAVLGLGIAPKYRIDVPAGVWQEIALHYIKGQQAKGPEVKERPVFHTEEEMGGGSRERIRFVDGSKGRKSSRDSGSREKGRSGSPTVARSSRQLGTEVVEYRARGWDYRNQGKENWNMTCGGASSMILVEKNLKGRVPPDFQKKISQSVRDGYAWLMRNWKPDRGKNAYYGLYSLEKVADLGEVKSFGSHDWFTEAAEWIIKEQRGDGSWEGENASRVRINTAFALLVLNRATAIITGRSAGRMAMTGRVRRGGGANALSWVYIPRYDREFHLPSLLRQVRLRPSEALARILKEALKNYPEEQMGYLVLHLVNAREGLFKSSPSLESFLDDQLRQITGVQYDDRRKYRVWYRRWRDIEEIGRAGKDPENLLARFYPTTNRSLPLKKKLLWAVGRCRAKSLAPSLLDDLRHEDEAIRKAAHDALSFLKISEDPIPDFDAGAGASERESQISRIREWYRKGN